MISSIGHQHRIRNRTTTLCALVDLHFKFSGAHPLRDPNSFHFYVHFHQKVPTSGVHTPQMGPRSLWEILDQPLV